MVGSRVVNFNNLCFVVIISDGCDTLEELLRALSSPRNKCVYILDNNEDLGEASGGELVR